MNYKYGHCPSCDRTTKWQQVHHHSGEKLWQCMGCHHEYRAKVPAQKVPTKST
jgi:ribosomal protein L37AE/L43A